MLRFQLLVALALGFLVACSQPRTAQGPAGKPSEHNDTRRAKEAPFTAAASSRGDSDSATLNPDLDGDSRADEVRVTRLGDNQILVAAVLHSERQSLRTHELKFGIDPSCQNCVCTWPVRLVLEPLDYYPDPDLGPLPGYRKSAKAFGFRIVDGECDDVHFYWNRDRKRLGWWRE